MKTESDKPRRSAKAAGLALLAMREHSRAELAAKLAQRGYEQAEIEPALADLLDDGYLNDERAAHAKVRSGVRRGHGPGRIRADLREAGLGSGALAGADDETPIDWCAQARAVADKRFGPEPAADYAEWAKRARFLQARGFDSDTIRRALGERD